MDFDPSEASLPKCRPVGGTDACFIIRDAGGQALAYVYFEDEPGRRAAPTCSPATKRSGSLPKIAKLPGLLQHCHSPGRLAHYHVGCDQVLIGPVCLRLGIRRNQVGKENGSSEVARHPRNFAIFLHLLFSGAA